MVSSRRSPVDAFNLIREMPYCTDGAHDAASLEARGRGDCNAKSALLSAELSRLGIRTRRCWWVYELPAVVEEVALLSSRLDIHASCQVRIGGEWRIVDATHDTPLAALGLRVSSWDRVHGTLPAYEPLGEVFVEDDPDSMVRYEAVLHDVTSSLLHTPPARIGAYRAAVNRRFEEARRSLSAAVPAEDEG